MSADALCPWSRCSSMPGSHGGSSRTSARPGRLHAARARRAFGAHRAARPGHSACRGTRPLRPGRQPDRPDRHRPLLFAARADPAARPGPAPAFAGRPGRACVAGRGTSARRREWPSARVVAADSPCSSPPGASSMRGEPRRCAGSTCRSPACPPACTASPSPSSATCTSGRRSAGPTSSASSPRSTLSTPTWWRSPATWSTARCPSSRPHVAPLADLRSREGSFFVTGNHEYYSGAAAWIAELRRLGLTVLANEHVAIRRGEATLVVAGVNDFSAGHFDRRRRAATRRRRSPAARRRRCACCSRTSRAAPRRPRRPASTCSSPATPTAASSCPGTSWSGCSSPSPPG